MSALMPKDPLEAERQQHAHGERRHHRHHEKHAHRPEPRAQHGTDVEQRLPERKLPAREHPDEYERDHQDAGAKQQVFGQLAHGEDERREPDGKQDERGRVEPDAATLAHVAHEQGARGGDDHAAHQRRGTYGPPAARNIWPASQTASP